MQRMLRQQQTCWLHSAPRPGLPVHRLTRSRCTHRVIRCSAVDSPEKELHIRSQLNEASKDLRPYMLWDRVIRLSASWDTRGKADFKHICDILQPRALENIIITKAEDAEGQPRTCLSIVCKPEDSDDVAAALLQWTPATHITATQSEQCYLPVASLTVETAYGPVDVQLSLAGSAVRKVTPDWAQCQQIADQQPQRQDASAVAAAAVAALDRGLKDGSIKIDAHLLF